MVIVVVLIIGILCLIIAIVSYKKYNKVIPILHSNTSEDSFIIEVEGDYAISVEGVNHGQITKKNIRLIDSKSTIKLGLEPIEHFNLRHRYKQKFYHNIFKFNVRESSSFRMEITDYGLLKTHHSKYKLVEKYSKNIPPAVMIHKFYPITKRLLFSIFLIGSMFLIPIGVFLIFKS